MIGRVHYQKLVRINEFQGAAAVRSEPRQDDKLPARRPKQVVAGPFLELFEQRGCLAGFDFVKTDRDIRGLALDYGEF